MNETDLEGVGTDFLQYLQKNPVGRISSEPGLLSRAAYHVGASPVRAAEGLSKSIRNLLGIEVNDTPAPLATQIEPATTGWGKVVDFAGGGLLPLVEEMAATGGVLKGLGIAKLASASPLAARVAQEGAAFGTIGLQTGREEGSVEAGIGGVLGASRFLPPALRVPLAAALGYGTKQYYDAEHPEPVVGGATAGDLAGSLNALFGVMGKRLPMRPGGIPDNFYRATQPLEPAGSIPKSAEVGTTPLGPQPMSPEEWAASMQQKIGGTGEASPSIATVANDPSFTKAVAERNRPFNPITFSPTGSGYSASEPIPKQRIPYVETPTLSETPRFGEDKLTSQMLPADARSADAIREFRAGNVGAKDLSIKRPLEAGYIDPALQAALGRAVIGGLTGGTVGAVADPDGKEGFYLGAAIGAGALGFGPAMLKTISELKVNHSPSVSGAQAAGAPLARKSYQEMVAKAKFAVSRGEDTFLDRSMERMDRWFASTRSENLKAVLGNAKGIVNFQVENMEEALRKASIGFKPDDALIKRTEEFLTGSMDEATYLQQLQSAPADAQAYGNLMKEARNSIDGLMEVASKGQTSKAREELLLNTRGEYLRQSYKLFNNPKYKPSQQAVNELADKLTTDGDWSNLSLDGKRAALWDYANQVQQAKGKYKAFSGSGESPKIDQSVFRKKKVLDQEWKNYLGDITDPVERVRLTLLKLKPMAEASEAMSQVVSGLKDDLGNPYVFADRTALESAQKTNPSTELQNYRYIPNDYRYGQLQGKMVHRHIADVLDDWENATQVDSAWGRSLVGLNRFMKSNVTYRNPAAIMRQVLSAPMMMALAKAHPKDWGETMASIRNPRSALGREMIERGIVNSDYVSRDVMREVDTVTEGLSKIANASAGKGVMGQLDAKILKGMGHLRSFDHKLADLFRAPDNFVRANAYVSAKYRIAKELGKAIDDPEVLSKATEFTNRYTMNYDLVAPVIKAGRNIPGLSLFLTYTAEISRIMKNIGEDAISGDGAKIAHALLALGTVAALPEIAQRVSESNLSEKDNEDWQKAKSGQPYYSQNRYKIVTGRDKKTGSFNYIDFSSIVPTDNFGQMARALIQGNFKDAAQLNPVVGWDNNPVLNILSQQITGENRYTHRPLRGTGDRLAIVANELGGPLTPALTEGGGGSIVRKGIQAFSMNADGELGLTDKKGVRLTPGDWWRTIAGVGSGQLNLNAIQKGQVAEAKAQVANEMAYLNDVIKSDSPSETKRSAAERTKLAIIAIQQQLEQQLK